MMILLHASLVLTVDSISVCACLPRRYLLVALCVTCLYSLLTALGRLVSASTAKSIFLLLLLDVVSTLLLLSIFIFCMVLDL